MKHLMIRCALTLLAAFAFSSAWAQSPSERAIQVLDQLDAGQIEEVTATFTDEMSAGLDAATLSQLWASLPQQLGALQQRGTPQEQRQDGHDVVLVPLQYERAAANAILSFNDAGQLAGLFVQPAQPSTPGAHPPPATPQPVEAEEAE